jgi:hypothetical protein
MSRHPSVEALLEFFDFDHLPGKLIEAKDCFVRAQVRAQRKRNAGG